jgi:hypothetical protein
VSTPPEVDALGAAQRSGQPATEEDHRGEHRRSSTPPEVDAPRAGQRSGRPATEEDCR